VQDQPAEPPAAPPQPSDTPPPVQPPSVVPPPPPPPVATPTPLPPPPPPPPQKTVKLARAVVAKPKPAPPKPEARLAASTVVVETKPTQTAPNATPARQSSTGQYLSYLVTLTRRHLDMLPADLVGNRRGKTVIAVHVADDGTIIHTRIAASSNYPDIDARIEQMVVAVGRFPPLPEQLRGQNIELDLNLSFPDVFRP
jgi:outer membrane biosynthesis protein TonB